MKYIVIVGGSKGIGREFIKQIIKNKKSKIILISRTNVNIKSDNIIHFKTDLLNENSINKTITGIRSLCKKINSILFAQQYRPSQQNNIFNDELMVNVKSTKIIIEGLVLNNNPLKIKSIVAISSIAASFIANEKNIYYHISKSALVSLVKFYATSLGHLGIRVNSISPSAVIKDENKEFYKKNKNISNLLKKISPLKSNLKSKNVAKLIQYFLSNKSNFITGQDIVIDGGISLQWQESLVRNLSDFSNISVVQK